MSDEPRLAELLASLGVATDRGTHTGPLVTAGGTLDASGTSFDESTLTRTRRRATRSSRRDELRHAIAAR